MSGACRIPFRKPWHLTSAHRLNTLLIFSVTLKSFRSTTEISNQHMITIKTHLGNLLSAMICGVVELVVVFQPNLWTLWEMEFGVHCVLSLLFLIPQGCLSSRYPLAPRWLRWAVTRVCMWTHSASLWSMWQELVPGCSHGYGGPATTACCLAGMWICHS